MQYPKSKLPHLENRLFENPGSEYRAAPFWAWNGELTDVILRRQMDNFKKMGFGGYFMHIRPGYTRPFFDKMYTDGIRTCIDYSAEIGMKAYLYDEDKWPSGYAGGEVARNNPEYSQLFMRLEREKSGDRTPFCAFRINFDADGYMTDYHAVPVDDVGDNVFYCREGTFEPSGWYGDSRYADTLSKAAMDKFIEYTHERLYSMFGDSFGTVSPLIFTDEPQFEKADKPFSDGLHKGQFGQVPWSPGFASDYMREYGYDITARIPELYFMRRDEYSHVLYDYYKYLLKRFNTAFCDNVGEWCDRHGIGLTGHYMCEYPLENQTRANAEAMYSYRSFSMPGIDMLIDLHEFITAKQAQSVVNQFDKDGVTSECYGVTGWQFSFRDYMHQGNWQAALGVRMRVPHLSWLTLESQAKRDFPPSINVQAPWSKEFSIIEDHFARLNTALTRAKSSARVAVIHPIESNWICAADRRTSTARYTEINDTFDLITNALLENTIDFDLVSESLLAEEKRTGDTSLIMGSMRYTTVIVPLMITIRKTTLDKLSVLIRNGGRVAVVGEIPAYVDGKRSDEAKRLLDGASVLPVTKRRVTEFCECERELTVLTQAGTQVCDKVCYLGDDTDCRWLFIAPMTKPKNPEDDTPRHLVLKIRGEYSPELYDTLSGKISPAPAYCADGFTFVPWKAYAYDTILLKLTNGKPSVAPPEFRPGDMSKPIVFTDKVPYTLDEPNVCLLDLARYSFDGQEFDRDDVIHIGKHFASKRAEVNKLTLFFDVESEISVDTDMALEVAEYAQVYLNGTPCDMTQIGEYMDHAEKKIHLGTLVKGVNEITVEYDARHLRTPEQMYLLGEFGVRVTGACATVTAKPEKIAFGDLAGQGFAFYGGTVTYHLTTPVCSSFSLQVTHIRGGLATVCTDGKRSGAVFAPPYSIDVRCDERKAHSLDVICHGNRLNTLSYLHNADLTLYWCGGNAWEQPYNKYSYEYMLYRSGILTSPRLRITD